MWRKKPSLSRVFGKKETQEKGKEHISTQQILSAGCCAECIIPAPKVLTVCQMETDIRQVEGQK